MGHTKSSCQVLASHKRNRRSKEKEIWVDEEGFASVSWRTKGIANNRKKVVAVATIIGFGDLKEDKPFELGWVTETSGDTQKKKAPAIALAWGECDQEMDFDEELVWN